MSPATTAMIEPPFCLMSGDKEELPGVAIVGPAVGRVSGIWKLDFVSPAHELGQEAAKDSSTCEWHDYQRESEK